MSRECLRILMFYAGMIVKDRQSCFKIYSSLNEFAQPRFSVIKLSWKNVTLSLKWSGIVLDLCGERLSGNPYRGIKLCTIISYNFIHCSSAHTDHLIRVPFSIFSFLGLRGHLWRFFTSKGTR